MHQLEYNKQAILYGEECIKYYQNRGRYYRNVVLPYDSLVNKYDRYKSEYEKKEHDKTWRVYCLDLLKDSELLPEQYKEKTLNTDDEIKTILRQIVSEGYRKAREKDKRDNKAFNNIGALILKEIDIKYSINHRAQFSLSSSKTTKRS